MNVRYSVVVAAGLSLPIVGGCAGPSGGGTGTEDKDIQSASFAACTQVIDATSHHIAELTTKGDRLTISESSLAAKLAPVEYHLKRVMLAFAPGGEPKFACEKGESRIAVWGDVARIGASYYELTPASPTEAGISCTTVLDPGDAHTAHLTVVGDELTVTETSSKAHYPDAHYRISKVMLAAAPSETPAIACTEGEVDIRLWDDTARVNGSYYSIVLVR